MRFSAIISTHVFTTGPAEALEEYLRPRTSSMLYIGHPFYYSAEKESAVRFYDEGKLRKKISIPGFTRFGLASYLRDMLVTTALVLLYGRRFRLFVGLDSSNAVSGMILKKIGYVRTVVFYSIDYVPSRFSVGLLNSLYHLVDTWCAKKCDFTWNLSPHMIRERRVPREALGTQLVVPIGTNFDRIQQRESDDVRRERLVYLGSLRRGQGVELTIDAMAKIRKTLPEVYLVIIGTGPLETELKDRARLRGVYDYITFTGRIEDHSEVERVLLGCGIGLALYEPIPESFTRFTDPGKIKTYMACGLPVITTRVTDFSKIIETQGAGAVIDYNATDLDLAVRSLLTNDSMYASSKKAALAIAQEYTWDNIFDRALASMKSVSPRML